MSKETSIQTKVKSNYEHEKLILDELVNIVEQHETKRDTFEAQNKTRKQNSTSSANQNRKRTK